MKEYFSNHAHELSGIILAGGESIRMGQNKAFLEVQGHRIIDQTALLLQKLFNQVILVTNLPLQYSYLDLEIVTDLIPQRSPLIGIYTGLFYSSCAQSFVCACDMPFLNRNVIEHMVSLGKKCDVVVPHLDDGLHPLHAIYSKRCLKWIEELIYSNDLKITNFFDKVKVREVSTAEIRSIDPTMNALLNINTPEDLEKATKAVSAESN